MSIQLIFVAIFVNMKVYANKRPVFIHLKEKVFAEYKIIYHINDGYAIKELSRFSSKHQLLFQKFSNKIQQMNLMYVDSIFPIHLADVALELFFNRVSAFRSYGFLEKKFVVIDEGMDVNYFRTSSMILFFTFFSQT